MRQPAPLALRVRSKRRDNSPTTVSRILPTTSFSERIWLRSESSRRTRAAIACGMPLPCEPGNTLCASQAQSTNPAGVMRTGSADCQPSASVTRWKSDCAASARCAKSTLIRPIAMAPAQKTIRGCHTRLEVHITRERRRTGKFFALRATSTLPTIAPVNLIKVVRRPVSTVKRDATRLPCYVRARYRRSSPIHPYCRCHDPFAQPCRHCHARCAARTLCNVQSPR